MGHLMILDKLVLKAQQGKICVWWLLLLVPLALASCVNTGAPWSPPPPGIQAAELVGVWEARYDKYRVDQLVLRADGTFKQTYRDVQPPGYTWETSWKDWRLERLETGDVRIHLAGARYYLAGKDIAEKEGVWETTPGIDGSLGPLPWAYYDPFSRNSILMVNELVLNVRLDKTTGEIFLHHMWMSGDRGFALLDGDREKFRRVIPTKEVELITTVSRLDQRYGSQPRDDAH